MTEAMPPDQLDHQRYWHALPVGWETLDYQTFLERRRSLIAKVVKDGFDRLWGEKSITRPSLTLADLLAVGESQTVGIQVDCALEHLRRRADKKMEHVITKTVCGFLNAEGGTLLIGVGDDGAVVGLADDMKTLGPKGNLDGYELFLRQHLDNNLSIQTAGIVQIRFERINGAEVCAVAVAASGKPSSPSRMKVNRSRRSSGCASATPPDSSMATTWSNTSRRTGPDGGVPGSGRPPERGRSRAAAWIGVESCCSICQGTNAGYRRKYPSAGQFCLARSRAAPARLPPRFSKAKSTNAWAMSVDALRR